MWTCLNVLGFCFLLQLIKVNQPDLVLFVGEALVGNEAVDQLTKFNQALADHSNMDNPRLIDGILLTKFDTIDDKVSEEWSIWSSAVNKCRKVVVYLYCS